jgi:Glucose-6-phosphate dehydrogenase subunit C-terminal domain/Glucose-6-phosphate dehydrogenase subunit N-terminal domain
VLNLIVVVDREWRGEIANRLEQVGRYSASRTIMCVVEQGRDHISAWARMSAPDHTPPPGEIAPVTEQVEIDVGPQHLPVLDTIVDPVVVPELLTVLWSPHGHDDAVDALLRRIVDVILLDSVFDPDPGDALTRVQGLSERAYVVDLAWLRSTPWRERVAATFDPADMRALLSAISGVTVRYRPDSQASAFLFVGWLASRLGWSVSRLAATGGQLHGSAHARRQDIRIRLDEHPDQAVPGLAGVTLDTAHGLSVSLDRAAGGLTEHRHDTDGAEHTWKVLGASRGEGGILGQGVRQALLRDPTYKPALDSARAMLP